MGVEGAGRAGAARHEYEVERAGIMFRKFVASEHCSGSTPVKSSVQRGYVKMIQDLYPALTDATLEEILPKKSQATTVRW